MKLPASCAPSIIHSLVPIRLPRCNYTQFTDAASNAVPMCGRGATCYDVAVSNVTGAATSPTCRCTGGTYTPATFDSFDRSLSPYIYDDYQHGCLARVHASALQLVFERRVDVSLRKTAEYAETRTLNLTLELSGTDWRAGSIYSWSVPDPSPASWLLVESTFGYIMPAFDTADAAAVHIPITLQSIGIQDGSSATTNVTVIYTPQASVEGKSSEIQVLHFVVTLYVGAVAVASTSSFEHLESQAIIDRAASFAFIARDLDGIPLQHSEVASFSAKYFANVTHSENGSVLDTYIEYALNGSYTVHTTPTLLGAHEAIIIHELANGTRQLLPSVLLINVGCPKGSYREGINHACTSCPQHKTRCDAPHLTLATLPLSPGFWRTSNMSDTILACPESASCIQNGSQVCAEDRTGPLCEVCTAGYYRHGERCLKCQQIAFSSSYVWLGLLVLMAIFLLCARRSNRCSTLKKRLRGGLERLKPKAVILIALYQVLSGMETAFKIVYPAQFSAMLGHFAFWQAFTLPDFGCKIILNYDELMMLKTLVPLGLLLCLGLLWLLLRQRSIMDSAFVVLFLVYPSASAAALGTFHCESFDDGHSYLVADYSIDCGTASHQLAQVLAGFMLIYPIGTPLLYAVILWGERNKIDAIQVAERARDSGTVATAPSPPLVVQRVTKPGSEEHVGAPRASELPVQSMVVQAEAASAAPAERVDAVAYDVLQIRRNSSSSTLRSRSTSIYDRLIAFARRVDPFVLADLEDNTAEVARAAILASADSNDEHRKTFSPAMRFLTDAYRLDYYWWEIVECLRKVVLTGLFTFYKKGSLEQLTLGLVVNVFFIQAYHNLKPYQKTGDNRYQQLCQLAIFVALLTGLNKFSLENCSECDSEDSTTISIVLNACAIIPLALIPVALVIELEMIGGGGAAKDSLQGLPHSRIWKLFSRRTQPDPFSGPMLELTSPNVAEKSV